jgi:DNA ligase-1
MSIIKPLLASEAPTPDKIRFPVLASSKLDGIRAIMTADGPQSRSGKLIPNKHVQAEFKHAVRNCKFLVGLDGELIVGEPNAKDVFRVTTSAVMSEDKTPDFKYYVFDYLGKGNLVPFKDRYAAILQLHAQGLLPKWVVVLPQIEVPDAQHLAAVEEMVVGMGFEGLIIRDPLAAYKHGRSSAREGILLKVRRFKDSEAEIIGFTEEMENQNTATKDAFGRTERSSHQDNLVGKNALGAFVVRDLVTKKEFQIGTGYTREEREVYWNRQKFLMGKIVKYRYFEVGVKDLPRFPVFQGFRDKRDMS